MRQAPTKSSRALLKRVLLLRQSVLVSPWSCTTTRFTKGEGGEKILVLRRRRSRHHQRSRQQPLRHLQCHHHWLHQHDSTDQATELPPLRPLLPHRCGGGQRVSFSAYSQCLSWFRELTQCAAQRSERQRCARSMTRRPQSANAHSSRRCRF